MPINDIRYFIHEVLIGADVDGSGYKRGRKGEWYSSVEWEFLVFYCGPEVCKGVVTGVLIGFESSGNSVQRVEDKVTDPVGEGGEEGDLDWVVKDRYLRDAGVCWWWRGVRAFTEWGLIRLTVVIRLMFFIIGKYLGCWYYLVDWVDAIKFLFGIKLLA